MHLQVPAAAVIRCSEILAERSMLEKNLSFRSNRSDLHSLIAENETNPNDENVDQTYRRASPQLSFPRLLGNPPISSQVLRQKRQSEDDPDFEAPRGMCV